MKFFKFIIILLFIFFELAIFKSAFANSISLKFEGAEFKLTTEDIENFSGQGSLPKLSPILNPRISAEEIIQNYFGLGPEEKNEKLFFGYRPEKIYETLEKISGQINSPAIEPKLKIENSRAVEFTPPQMGKELLLYQSTLELLNALEKNLTEVTLKVKKVAPQNSLEKTNSLGINELLAVGASNFAGSPNNRRHNIAVGYKKFQGIVLKPGEEFSFNKFLGPVEEEQGFLPELVIKKTGTVPELGGGLCQVSSTAFRGAMEAGLPIIQRKNHAYAVQYYSPQGTDATIYPGVIDLKFMNDTPGHVLIWSYLKDKNNLVFEYYGTKDTRRILLEKPVVYDRKTDGSMKAYWNRKIIKGDEEKTESFKSIYASPALFHKEEKFISPQTNSETNPQTIQ